VPSSFTATSHIRPSGASTIVYCLDIPFRRSALAAPN
jgi:hypothetical protein